jgi:Na+/proline symporter/nitrogen-specific signal transduction histidine kinase
MLNGISILVISALYLSLLFAIAYWGDKRADQGRSLIRTPYVYALSIAVYCTSWTYYGSVGRAATHGYDFLAIYIGPTLVFVVWWFVLRKIIRITKANRITSIADFISSRYGKSPGLSGLVTVIAVVGIMPYISLQLKAVSVSFTLILGYPDLALPHQLVPPPFPLDTALMVALALAAFSILFGTRHIDASEHHEGMVLAIAFESVVKLIAFLAVGIFVTFHLYDGFDALFAAARQETRRMALLSGAGFGSYGQWVTLIILSMAATICLPRQFQVTAIENVDERHIDTAAWMFPLYLLIINIFVLPIAMAGTMMFPGGSVDADTYVLSIPIVLEQEMLSLFSFIGGLSAATGMVIVATIALSTMVCNDLVMPVLLRFNWFKIKERGDLSGLLLDIRRGSIIAIVLLSYFYYHTIGESYALVTIGLVSFAAAAQFAPAIIGGIFWKGGTRTGALAGLMAGFMMWLYTLVLPSFARSGWLPAAFMTEGAFGLDLLKPYALFGMDGMDHLSHALFWTMLVNVGAYVGFSLITRASAIERVQASLFVDVFRLAPGGGSRFWRGTASVSELLDLARRFVGRDAADAQFAAYARENGINLSKIREADPDFVNFTEQLLAGAIGAASAQVMVARVATGEMLGIDEVMRILDETSQVIEYSHRLEQKSRELEAASAELRAANVQLRDLDEMKDDFLGTVSHELRTPMTSIRAFAQILADTPELAVDRRREFLDIIVKESERLTRLINQILDLEKLDSGRNAWNMDDVDPARVIRDSIAATQGLLSEREVELLLDLPSALPAVHADRDRLHQIMVNLLSNAFDFCDRDHGSVRIGAVVEAPYLRISVSDNGAGVPETARDAIFDKFQQSGARPSGGALRTGLGLAICRRIVEQFGGRIWIEDTGRPGACFSFTVPLAAAQTRAATGD